MITNNTQVIINDYCKNLNILIKITQTNELLAKQKTYKCHLNDQLIPIPLELVQHLDPNEKSSYTEQRRLVLRLLCPGYSRVSRSHPIDSKLDANRELNLKYRKILSD